MDTIELGGNINLSGFSSLDFTELIVVKKIVGQYARKLSDTVPEFTRLTVARGDIHHTTEGHGKIELTVRATVDGKEYTAQAIGHNMFMVLDECLKDTHQQIRERH